MNHERNLSRARLEWNQAKGFSSVLMGAGHEVGLEDSGSVILGVRAAMKVGVAAVEEATWRQQEIQSTVGTVGSGPSYMWLSIRRIKEDA